MNIHTKKDYVKIQQLMQLRNDYINQIEIQEKKLNELKNKLKKPIQNKMKNIKQKIKINYRQENIKKEIEKIKELLKQTETNIKVIDKDIF